MKIAVIGAGAWGTTIAILLAEKGHDVVLWAREPERATLMEETRENERYLSSFRFPDSLHIVSDGIGECDLTVGAVPTQHMRAVFSDLALPRTPFISLSKGIEIGTLKMPTEIYRETAGADRPAAMLTGPCIAKEIAQGLPAAVVVAGDEAEMLQAAFNTDRFRVYTSDDPFGCELVGALKNVMAIAAGIVDGMGLGDNTKAALLTRGIVEIARLGTEMGAQAKTFYGLAGFGDLFTTCVSPFGRNRTVGERIGRGETLDEILESTTSVAEGVSTTKAVVKLAEEKGIDMPITTALHAVLFAGVSIEEAIGTLMTRERGAEG